MFGHNSSVSFIGGVISYLGYFHHGERHAYPWRYPTFLILMTVVVFLAKCNSQDVSLQSYIPAVVESFALLASYLLGLLGSLIVYRLVFNPLNKFPGPWQARLTKLYHTYLNADLLGHHELHNLHRKYGPYVRIGPNDLSITDPDAMTAVLGPNSRCRKSAWYGQDMPYVSTNTTRDRAAHDRRRRILSAAFSDRALREYEARARRFHDLLLERMEERVGEPVNVTQWFGMHGFDMMGDLVFGKSLDMLETGRVHEAVELMGKGLQLQGYALPPWLYRLCAAIPLLRVGSGFRRFTALACEQLDDCVAKAQEQQKSKVGGCDSQRTQMIQPLLEHYLQLDPRGRRAALPLLQGDSKMLIVAGSDTTSTTMINLCYRLAKEEGLVDRLRAEIEDLIPTDQDGAAMETVTYQQLRPARLLHGCIDETLRLHYPAPSGFFRKTPSNGLNIGDVYVPGNTVIQSPPHVMAQDESIYTDAASFRPERWTLQPELVKRRDAFLPFLAGTESCIGKNLAYVQLAVLTARLLARFDVAFAPGEDGRCLVDKSKDLAMLHPASLWLVFTRRGEKTQSA